MPSGNISKLLFDRGFGFVRDSQGVDHFFHRTGVQGGAFRTLQPGQSVDFDIEMSAKGLRATHVRVKAFDEVA